MSTVADTPTTIERTGVDEDVDGFDVTHFAGWFCIQTDPWACPNPACNFSADYITALHTIIVWPAKDDSSLLAQADNAQKAGRNPKVVEYEPEMGPCWTFDAWMAAGRPVHGQQPEPDNWVGKKRL